MKSFLSKFLLVCGVLCWVANGWGAEAKPNIVFIMLDDMGYGDAGCYNPDSKIPTPNIDRLANEGMRFTDAHAPASVCVPSRYGFLTGRYPPSRQRDCQIPTGTETIASVLKRYSYKTAMVGKWHNGFENIDGWKGKVDGGPCGSGFDTFYGIPHSLDIQPYLYIENNQVVQAPTKNTAEGKKVTAGQYDETGWNKIQGAFWRKGKKAPDFKHEEVLGNFTSKAISTIKDFNAAGVEQPFFLYLAYAGPHTPWLPSDAFKGKSGAGLYGDFLMEIDDAIGKVMDALEQAGIKEDTLVMLSSDNGPVWYQKNAEKYDHHSTGPLRGAKAGSLEGGHRMPFIASWPAKIAAQSVCEETVCLTDMMRTFASAAGETLPDELGRDSYDMLPLLLDAKSGPVRDVTVHRSRTLAIRKGKYKYLDG